MASASSALPVVFDAKGACVVDNAVLGVVRASDVGECSITVAQKGDGSWKAAAPVTRSITISRATPVISGFEDTSTEHVNKVSRDGLKARSLASVSATDAVDVLGS